MALHEDALTEGQRAAAAVSAKVAAKESYYLAGGAALALQLGHRRSVDLDWFRRRKMGDPLKLARSLTRSGVDLDVTTTAEGTLYGVADGVKMSFIEYPYKLLAKPVAWEGPGISLASLEDIACMKLSAIGGRGAKKDFVDLYFLGQHMSLESMLDRYKSKFGVSDIAHVVMALAYFDDAERQKMPVMLKKVSWKTVKSTIQGWVHALR